jgi:hypothetical protein
LAARRTCILVLGMHRSGTSATTRVLNLLGGALPAQLLSATPNNLRGHWEPTAIVRLHDETLQAIGSSWDDFRALDEQLFFGPARTAFKQRLQRTLSREYGESPTFVVKDPRVCRLLPCWIEALDEIGIDARAVFPLRNPRDVIQSLAARDRMTPTYGYLLWARHVLDAEKYSRDIPRAFFLYEQLLTDWRTCVEQLSAVTNLVLPTDPLITSEIDKFLSPELTHHRSSIEQLRQDPATPPFVPDIYQNLLGYVTSDRETEDALDDMRERLAQHGPAHLSAMHDELTARRQEIDQEDLRNSLTRANEVISRLQHDIERERTANGELRHALATQDSTIIRLQEKAVRADELGAGLHALTEAQSVLRNQIERERAGRDKAEQQLQSIKIGKEQLERQLDSIQASISWRLTSPLRGAARMLRRLPAVR